MIEQQNTILVVDDQPGNLKVLFTFLKKHGYQICVADTGERAVAALQKEKKPDLVLLDVMMPGIDGFETCRQIKINPDTCEIPVIFMTALDSVEDKVAGFEAGGVDFITKPFQQAEVLARVNTHVILRQQKAILEETRRELLQHKRRLEDLSITDPLTGLYNRRNLDIVLQREFVQAKRYNNDLACLMLDLDHFKRINDTYGHEFGDSVLQKFAAILTLNVRSGDSVFRYGGEEFVVVLPQTDSGGAVKTGEKIRKALADAKILNELTGELLGVTTSVGVSALRSHGPVASHELIGIADKALYTAKANGRNQIVFQEIL
ncbi:diguanylate cyclase [Methanococcoides sp. SA1]|nr:diguanylate cyclase [Methanococcoides sp. SA1]